MKYLGIDCGTKRIGIAISDDTGSVAFPLTTLQAGSTVVDEISAIVQDEHIETIVLGESRNFQGATNPVMEHIAMLRQQLEAKGYEVVYEPEFFTTVQARKEGETPKEHIDASAAALILQSYLDRQKARPGIE